MVVGTISLPAGIFGNQKKSSEMRERLLEWGPRLVVLCPPYGPFSNLQFLRKEQDTKEFLRKLSEKKNPAQIRHGHC